MHKQKIQHVHLAVYSSCTQYLMFRFSTGARECVCAFIFKHPQGVLVDVRACV